MTAWDNARSVRVAGTVLHNPAVFLEDPLSKPSASPYERPVLAEPPPGSDVLSQSDGFSGTSSILAAPPSIKDRR